MIADNDEATGRFIDALSHSNYWASSVGVRDRGRSAGRRRPRRAAPLAVPGDLAVGQARLHLERALRRAGDVAHDDAAARRRSDQPARRQRAGDVRRVLDRRPTCGRTRSSRARSRSTTNTADAPMAEESKRIDFSRPDTAPLGRILWKAMHGQDAEPPWGASRSRSSMADDDDDLPRRLGGRASPRNAFSRDSSGGALCRAGGRSVRQSTRRHCEHSSSVRLRGTLRHRGKARLTSLLARADPGLVRANSAKPVSPFRSGASTARASPRLAPPKPRPPRPRFSADGG